MRQVNGRAGRPALSSSSMLKRLVALFVALAACTPSPPPAQPVADLDIKKMPDAGGVPVVRAERAFAPGGKCDATTNQVAPPLAGSSLLGRERVGIELGRVTIVYFWATWAGPCGEEMPKLQHLYAQYKDRGVDLVAVSVDDETTGIDVFAKNLGVRYPIVWDDGHRISQCWRIDVMPSTFVVDREGVVRHELGGYHDGDVAKLEAFVQKLL